MTIDIRQVQFGKVKQYTDMHFIASPELVDLVTDGSSLLAAIVGHDEQGRCIQIDIDYESLRAVSEEARALMELRLALHDKHEAFGRYE